MSKENAQEFRFIWKIHNFSLANYKIGEVLASPIFEVDSFGGSQWCIRMFPCGEDKKNAEYVSVYLCKKKNDIYSEISSLICELEFIADNGGSLGKHSTSSRAFKLNASVGWNRFMLISSLNCYLKKWPENALTLRCYMFNICKQRAFDFEMHTEMPVNRCSFLWNVKIPDISSQIVGKEIYFSEKSLYEITLIVPDDADVIKICINQREEESIFPKFVECKLSLVNSKKNELTSKRASHSFEPNDKNDVWEFPSFITKEDVYSKSDIWENGTFSLFCEFVASDGIKSAPVTSTKYATTTNKDNRTVLHEDLKSLLRNHIHSDIKLKVENEVLHAHKSILAARSPVFSAMFDRNMIESKTGVVDIPDFEANVLKVFLEFVYTGAVENFDYEKAKKLLVVADKYQVQSLTEKCVTFLEAILSLGNVIEVLSISDMINHERLKNTALNFIAANSVVIFKTPEWQDLIRENVKLAGEMISIIAANFQIVPST